MSIFVLCIVACGKNSYKKRGENGSNVEVIKTGTKIQGSHNPQIYGMRVIGDYLYVKNNFRFYLGNLEDELEYEKNPYIDIGKSPPNEEEYNKYYIRIGLEIETIHESSTSPAGYVNITDEYICI